MALTIPNIESSPTFDGQSAPDATDFAALQGTDDGNGVITGCQVSAQSSPNMTVQVAAGTVLVNGQSVAVSAVSSLTISAASTYDRKDIVVVNSSGTVSVTEGTPCTTAGWTRNSGTLPPVKPAIPSNSVLLGEVYVASTTTSIASGNIIDKTTLTIAGNVVTSYITSNVSVGATTYVNLTSVTLGAGTWLLTARALLGKTSTTDYVCDIFLGPTSASKTSAYCGATAVFGESAEGVEYGTTTLTYVVTLSASTTIYLEAYSSGALTDAYYETIEESIPNATGITAVRVA